MANLNDDDRALLVEISRELTNRPFTSVLCIAGSDMPRKVARAMERRLQELDRGNAPPPVIQTRQTREAIDIASRRVDRDPCAYCGVRADVGCKHNPHFSERAA